MKRQYMRPQSPMVHIRVGNLLAASIRVNSVLGDDITYGGDDTEGQWASSRDVNHNLWDEE